MDTSGNLSKYKGNTSDSDFDAAGETDPFSQGDISDCFGEERKKSVESNPELDNFLYRVDEITEIIHGLASDNPTVQEKALKKADFLIHDGGDQEIREDEEDGTSTAYKVSSNRTVINTKSPDEDAAAAAGHGDNTAFMRMVEKDSKERADDRRDRKERSDQFRKNGNIAFRNQNFAEALDNFNKALALVKDSPCLFNNRALTYLRIGIYNKAIQDCDKAIYLAEGSIKAHLLKAKAYFLKEEPEKCRSWLDETRERFPSNIKMIDEYQKEIFEMRFLNADTHKKKSEKSTNDFYDADEVWKKAARHEILPSDSESTLQEQEQAEESSGSN